MLETLFSTTEFYKVFGGRRRTRTSDQLLKSQLLCQLSYTPTFVLSLARPAGFEPATYGFEARRSIQLSYGRFSVTKLFNRNALPCQQKILDMGKKLF